MKRSALVMLAGCGRIAFDPSAASDGGSPDSGSTGLPTCFEDALDDADISNWTTAGEWTSIASGRSGAALRNNVDLPEGATAAGLMGVASATVAFDLRLEAAFDGDFHLYFMAPGWTDPSNDSKYRVALFPEGSDNPDDNVRRVVAPQNTTLAMTPAQLATDQWYRVVVTLALDHAISVTIDGAPHLASPADAMLAGPFDIIFDGYRPFAIDNVDVGCTR